jgi:hypothetical protein
MTPSALTRPPVALLQCELSVRAVLASDIERAMEDAIISVSQMVRERYDGLVVTDSALM